MKRGSSLLRHLVDCDKHANSLHSAHLKKKTSHFFHLCHFHIFTSSSVNIYHNYSFGR